jgi:ribonuclease P protein component
MTPLKIISLKNQKEFDQLNKLGKKIVTKYFILILQKEPVDTSKIYLGLKISKKVGNAVVRNKTRRRFKSLVRDLTKTEIGAGFLGSKFLIIPKHSMLTAKYADILHQFMMCII